MYTKIDEYKDTLKSDEQQYDAYIVLEDGTKVDTDISAFKVISNLGQKIIGNFVSKRIEFNLFNTNLYNITNKEFEAFVGLKVNGEFNYISLGKFIANKPEIKDEKTDECSITAQDYSLKFKVKYEPVITFPCTVSNAIQQICNYLNISYKTNSFINADYILEEFFIDEEATFFEVIKTLVEAGFANAYIDNTNSLIIKSPRKTSDYSFALNEIFELQKEDNRFGPLNAIVASRVVADDGTTTEDIYARNEESITQNEIYEYKIIQNDAIDYDRQTAVDNILAGILDFEYIPATIEAVYNPALEVGDLIEVPDVKTDTSFLLYVKEITVDLANGLMTIESSEETITETDYKAATVKDKRKKTEYKVNKMEGKITELIQETTEQGEKITEAEKSLDGITQRVSEIENNVENTIKKVEVQYALADSSTEAPTTGWSTKAPEWESGKYMWQKTVTTYADETVVESEATCITGAKGETGKDGTSVTILGSYDTLEELKAEHPTGNIGDAYIMAGDLYVWVENINDWDNVGTIQGPQGEQGIQGEKGDKGDTGETGAQGPAGETGIGVKEVVPEYYLSTSDEELVDGEWSENQGEITNDVYMWTSSKVTWTDGTVTTTTPVLATPMNDIFKRVTYAESKLTEHEYTIGIHSKNIDAEGNITSVKTLQGFTFGDSGLNIYTSENSFNTQINNEGSYYKDGDEIVASATKDGFMGKDFKEQGQHSYGYTGDEYLFVDELIEVDGEYAEATFYNGV